MKVKMLIIGLLLLSLLPSYSYASGLGEMRISLLAGDVQVRQADASEWVPASINMPLTEGDSLWVPQEARTEIQLRNGTSVRLDAQTSLDVLRVDKDSFQFYLAGGRAYVYLRGSANTLLQMDTPVSSISAYDNTIFMADVGGDRDADVSVFRGSVNVESRGGRTRVAANKTLSLRGDDYSELMTLGSADEWERWNRDRDKMEYGRMYSSTYLPDELESYANDLGENGKWLYTGDYGYVWTPTAMVSAGWAPYRNGRWTWVAGDYVWVSYEPWGWAPYHYGRWTFVTSTGWCWVPPARGAVYWGPGYVGWVQTPTYVAWVPLGPGEIYYGHGYYGPHSVNITNINIEKTVINNVYRNVHINNAVTIINRDTFVKGRQIGVSVKENPFLREKIHVGRPEIKPERASFMPLIKEIPRAKQPPQQIRDLQVKQLLKERPLVKEPRISAFRPGTVRKNVIGTNTPAKSFGVVKTPEVKVSPQTRQMQPFNPGRVGNEEKISGRVESNVKPPAVQPSFQRSVRNARTLQQAPAGGSVIQNKQGRAPASEVRIPDVQLRAGAGKSDRQVVKIEPRVVGQQRQLPLLQGKPAGDTSPAKVFSARPVVERQGVNITKETGGKVKEERVKSGNEGPVQRSASPFR